MLCDVKHRTDKMGLNKYPGKIKILSNQSTNRRTEIEFDNIEVKIIHKRRKHQISWTNGHFPATGKDRDQGPNLGPPGRRSTIKIVPSSRSAPLVRHGDHPDDELRIRHMDTRTRKNDSNDAAQNAPLHQTNKRKIQKDTRQQCFKK